MKKLLTLAAVATAAVLAVAGCGTGTEPSGPHAAGEGSRADAAFNRHDVRFAGNMIVHHEQALTMSKMVDHHDVSPRLSKLAADIQAAQRPEINTMTRWLKAWGRPGPSRSMGGMKGMDHSMSGEGMSGMGGAMPGMMSGQALDDLDMATGSHFEEMWLRGMIRHHQGAITMSRTEITKGKNPDAIALAKDIVHAQSIEITAMKQMLRS
jgi:uncharacterized protein (DUF305 family)